MAAAYQDYARLLQRDADAQEAALQLDAERLGEVAALQREKDDARAQNEALQAELREV